MALEHYALFTLALPLLFLSVIKADSSEVFDLMVGNATFPTNVSNIEDVDGPEVNFEEFSNLTNLTDEQIDIITVPVIPNVIVENSTSEQKNETALPSIMAPGTAGAAPAIGTAESAVILAGVFVLLAATGFGGMFAWRRYLQVRYGNSDMLITDDVYDITDLRNFEI